MSLSNPKEYAIAASASQPAAGNDADPTYFLPKVQPGRLLGILLRRGWIVVLLAVLGTAAMFALAGKMTKTYRATGSVYVSSQAPQVLDIRAIAPEETRDLEQMRSVEQGMAASTLLLRVMEVNGLFEDPEFAPKGAGRQALLEKFTSRVRVELRRGSRIIDMSVEDTDPARAKRLVESLVTEYEMWTTDRQQLVTRQAGEGLAREEERLAERMAVSAGKLQEFRELYPIPGLEGSESGSPVRDELGTLSAELTQAKAERLRLESEYEALVKFDAADPKALAGLEQSERATEVLSQVKAIQQKEADFARLKERYLERHPLYKEASNEIALLKANLADTTRAAADALEQRYGVAKENESKLEAAVTHARSSAVGMEGLREQYRSLSREAEADRTLHASVALRLRETALAATVPASVLRWEDTPMQPETPFRPRKIVFAAVGAFGGFLCGMMLLVLTELADGKIRDSAAAARATGAPLLATLPKIPHASDGMILLSDPTSAAAEAFRRLRAVLAPPPGSSTARTVLFTSAKASEGRSFCALNYATSLAMQGHRTLLLDADLRRAGISAEHLKGVHEESGLGGYLAGKNDPASACFTTALPNLYMMSSGPVRADAAELLAGTRFPALLEEAFRWFDRVVIDSPPVLSVSDMLAMARYADRNCLVVRDRVTDRRELKRAAELIRSAGGNLVGFVWNECTAQDPDLAGAQPVVPVHRTPLTASAPTGVATASPDTDGLIPKFA